MRRESSELKTRLLQPNDPALTWAGAVSVQHATDASRAWRLPHQLLSLYPGPELQERSVMAAGVRITFRTDSRRIGGRIVPAGRDLSPLDLVVDGRVIASRPMAGRSAFDFTELGDKRKEIELWLPQFGRFGLVELSIDAGAVLESATPRRRPRLVTYGSSITQCRTADSPTRTWPALLARYTDSDLTCLGFGGQCHLDPMIARLIRDRPAELITCCLGINVHGAGTFNRRSFAPAVLGFLDTIRDGHPDTPVVAISPLYSAPRELVSGGADMTLSEVREEVNRAVRTLQQHGDGNLHLIDGRSLIGPRQAGLLPDDLHPSSDGYRHLADTLFARLDELGLLPMNRPATST